MAKRKNVALFEAISRSSQKDREGLAVPTWAAKSPQADGVLTEPVKVDLQPQEDPKPRLGFKLSFNKPVIAALLAAITAVVGVAYFVGRTGQSSAPPAEMQGQLLPTGADRLMPNGIERGSIASLPDRKPGKFYLVVQSMSGQTEQERQDAIKIAEWLWKVKQEPAEVRTLSIGGGKKVYAVWSLRPFDSNLSADANEFAAYVEALGQEYKKEFGKYWFSQRRQGKLDPFYVKDNSQPSP